MTPLAPAPASLPQRIRARILDLLLTVVVASVALPLLPHPRGWSWTLAVLTGWLLGGVGQGMSGATPGQWVAGVRVIDSRTAQRIGVLRAVLRQGLILVAGMVTLGLGWASVGLSSCSDPTGRRRGWHDQWCATAVVIAEDAGRGVASPPAEPAGLRTVNLTDHLTGVVPLSVAPWLLRLPDGRVEPLTAMTLIGREPAATGEECQPSLLALHDSLVSRRHLMLVVDSDGVTAIDQGATNATVIMRGNERIELAAGQTIRLQHLDLLVVGGQRLCLEHSAADEAAEARSALAAAR